MRRRDFTRLPACCRVWRRTVSPPAMSPEADVPVLRIPVQGSDALADFRVRAPAAHLAPFTWEHDAPVLMAADAAAESPGRVAFPVTGWWMDGAFTKRSVRYGQPFHRRQGVESCPYSR